MSYVALADKVIERIEIGVQNGDEDAVQAKEWADDYHKQKGSYAGIDGHLDKMFRSTGKPDAVKKFVDLK